jgi:hypothetical protein
VQFTKRVGATLSRKCETSLKKLRSTNTLAYFASPSGTNEKGFMKFPTDVQEDVIKKQGYSFYLSFMSVPHRHQCDQIGQKISILATFGYFSLKQFSPKQEVSLHCLLWPFKGFICGLI